LGNLYENGAGVEQDLLKAEELYKMAADKGSALGSTALNKLQANHKGELDALHLMSNQKSPSSEGK
jgi:TPR repeat protein